MKNKKQKLMLVIEVGYHITGRGGERGVFHLMHKNKFFCGAKTPKTNLIIAEASIGDVECIKCLKKMLEKDLTSI